MRYPFDPATGLVVVRARLFGPRGDAVVDLALDSGATTSLINWPTALALGYDPARSQHRIEITTASGREYCPVISVSAIEVLGKRMSNLEVVCHDLPARASVRGLLGLHFMRRFDVRINFKQGFITLR